MCVSGSVIACRGLVHDGVRAHFLPKQLLPSVATFSDWLTGEVR